MNKKTYSLQYVSPTVTAFHYDTDESGIVDNKLIEDSELRNILREIFSFSRYHPENPYLFRKSIPSPRSIHPFLPLLVVYGACFLYDAARDSFVYIGVHSIKDHDIQIMILIDIWRICSVYGEFGFPLSILESGHILVDLHMLLKESSFDIKHVDYSFKQYNREFPNAAIKNAGDLYILYSVVIKSVHSNQDVWRLKHKAEIKKKYNYTFELSNIGIDQLFFYASKEKISLRKRKYPSIPELHLKREKRNSLNAKYGLFNLGSSYSNKDLHSFLSFLDHTICSIDIKQINIYFMINHIQGMERGAYRYRNGKLFKLEDSLHLYSIFKEGHNAMNVDSLPFAVVLSASSVSNQLKEFIVAHVNAAEIIQTLSLFFAEKNTFSRPIRNLNDEYCKKICKPSSNEHFIYGCLFGHGNSLSEMVLR
ncbi:hypothetical protein QUF44_13040 [Bacillus subtilis]|nr:hypothetical protein [Bacillus subtilis]MDM5302501.1 hypothetical protein [Bacillus subtilis]MDM5324554.1 hypothetical protein [Bacillus subtilis]